MKRRLKTVVLLNMALILMVGMCLGVSAAEILYEEYGAYVNPAYADVLGEDDLAPLRVANGLDDEFNPEDYETDFDSAVQSIIEKLVNRDISVSVKFRSENPNGEEVCIALLDAAVAHTGTPWEGDYIRYTYGGYQFSIGGWQTEDAFYYNFTYAPTYFTNLEQEDFVDAEVTAILDETITADMTDYEKVSAIYDYITENVIYDYDHLEDESYKLQYTAYAALHDGTAVCQGYANLFYRMALESDVDARIISGIGGDETNSGPHAWNIVNLNEWYYDLDATWDASQEEYSWFLRSEANFPMHIRDDEYASAAFYDAYPMAEEDYSVGDSDDDDGDDGDDPAQADWVTECPDGDYRLDTAENRMGAECWDDNNPDFAFDKAFDSNVDTYYDAAASATPDMYIGLDLGEGESARLTRVDVYPRAEWAERMDGLRLQGSPDGMQWLTLFVFPADEYSYGTYTVTWDMLDEELRDMQFREFRLTTYQHHLSLTEAAFYGDDEGAPLTDTYYKLVPTMDLVEAGNAIVGVEGYEFFTNEEDYDEEGRITYRGIYGGEDTYFIAEAYIPYHEDGKYVIPGTYDGKIIAGIGDKAFYGNTDMKNVVVWENISWIDHLAFMNCTEMETFAIPHSLRWAEGDVWADCHNLQAFLYSGDWMAEWNPTDEEYNADYDVRFGHVMNIIDGVLFSHHGGILVRYPNDRTGSNGIYVVPDTNRIGPGAFQDVHSLKSVVMPHVEALDYNAFAFSSVEYIAVSQDLNWIEDGVFAECFDLKKVITLSWDFLEGALNLNEDYDPDDQEWNEESGIYRFREMNIFTPGTVVAARGGSVWEDYAVYLEEAGCGVSFEEQQAPGWFYGVNDWDEVVLYGYFDEWDVLEIPAEIDGMPVVEVQKLYHLNNAENKIPVRDLVFPDTPVFIENWLFNFQNASVETITLPAGKDTFNLAAINACNSLTDLFFTGESLTIYAHGWEEDGAIVDEFVIREDGRKINLHCSEDCDIILAHVDLYSETGEEYYDYAAEDNPYLNVVRDADTAKRPISVVCIDPSTLYPGDSIEDYEIWGEGGRFDREFSFESAVPFAEGEYRNLTITLTAREDYEFADDVTVFVNGYGGGIDIDYSPETIVLNVMLPVGYLSAENAAAGIGLEAITDYTFVDGSYGFEGEGPENLWDNDKDTKLCTDAVTAYSVAELAEPASIGGVILTTASDSGDYPGRLPCEWTISGSNDCENWDVIYSGSRDVMMDANSLSYPVVFDHPSAEYRYFCIDMGYPNNGILQLADVTLCKAAEEEPEDHIVIASGYCGGDENAVYNEESTAYENLAWTLYDDGRFVISGEGEMKDYEYSYLPWLDKRGSIKTVVIESGVTSISSQTFNGCSSLTNITIPETVTRIGSGAFYGCSSLTGVTIPYGVTDIGDHMFCGCSSLTSIRLPDSVTNIGEYVFYNCGSLTNIAVDEDNSVYCDIDGVLFDKEQTVLIQYPQGNSRTEYDVPNGVTNIGEYAFSGCNKLKNITLPDSVAGIGDSAFEVCTGLTGITFSDSVLYIGAMAFVDCYSLTNITVDVDNPVYCDIDGVLFDKEQTLLIQYPAGASRNEYVIPYGVTAIGDGAFSGCRWLSNVIIPAGVTSIGNDAFYSCQRLANITLPSSVTSIGDQAFYSCRAMMSITLPASVTNIGGWAFAFDYALKAAYFEGDAPTLGGGGVFFNAAPDFTIYYNEGTSGWTTPTWNGCNTVALVSDEEDLTVTVENVTGFVGKTVRVPIILSDNPGIISMSLKISYDTDVFTLIGVEDSELLPGGMHSDRYVSPYYLVWENDTSRENFTVNGTIAELVFAVADDAPEGDYAIEITSPKDGVMNSAGDSVECRLVSGVCTVSDYIPGDVNGDGDVTNKDRLILARYLADWEGYELSDMIFGASDINGDGELTNKDRLILARYLADWEGYGDLTAFRQ